MNRGPEQTILPKRHTNDQWLYEKILNFTKYKKNAKNKNKNMVMSLFYLKLFSNFACPLTCMTLFLLSFQRVFADS